LSVQRTKETELKANLRQIREAIDAYKKAVDDGHIKKTIEQSGYPPNLEILVEGVQDDKTPNHHKMKFLRSIPLDPITASINWGLRSYSSDAEHPTEGDDVYDVYSLSQQVGINGIPYKQW
jgi:general secretion pathway protein G